jgi:hypothetical protein
LYEGIVAGSNYNEPGSAEYLCLHKEPQFLEITPGFQGERGRIHGSEYLASQNPPAFSNMLFHNAPCAVCYSEVRSTKITIPARTSCPSSWTREYIGYLMADRYVSNHASGRVPICVDSNSESVPGSGARGGNSFMYFLETSCAGIPCPPYSSGAELSCVVCTK